MHARSQRMYTPTMISTMIVATKTKAVTGSYLKPRISGTARPITHCTSTATYGDLKRGWTAPRKRGSTRMRAKAYAMRVETFEPALELAIVELTIAKNTNTKKMPYEAFASPSHEAAPAAPNVENLSGPYAMATADGGGRETMTTPTRAP